MVDLGGSTWVFWLQFHLRIFISHTLFPTLSELREENNLTEVEVLSNAVGNYDTEARPGQRRTPSTRQNWLPAEQIGSQRRLLNTIQE